MGGLTSPTSGTGRRRFCSPKFRLKSGLLNAILPGAPECSSPGGTNGSAENLVCEDRSDGLRSRRCAGSSAWESTEITSRRPHLCPRRGRRTGERGETEAVGGLRRLGEAIRRKERRWLSRSRCERLWSRPRVSPPRSLAPAIFGASARCDACTSSPCETCGMGKTIGSALTHSPGGPSPMDSPAEKSASLSSL